MSNGTVIAGATGREYIPTAADVGTRLSATVTLSAPGYSSRTATADPSEPVIALYGPTGPGAPLTGSTPRILGQPQVGVELAADPGSWTPGAVLTYVWLAAGRPVPGATTSTFVPGPAQVGASLSVRVTGRLSDAEVRKTSVGSAGVLPGSLVRGKVLVSGKARVGRSVSAILSGWSGGTTSSYRWLVDGKAVKKATAARLKVTRAMLGRRLSVRVRVTRPGYTSLTATSARTAKVRR